MPNMHLELRTEADLEQAMDYISWLNRPVVKDVSLDISTLGKAQEQKLAKRLQRLFNDCGCLWGAPGFFLGSGIYLLSHLQSSGASWTTLGISALIGTGSALGAKFLGLLWSFWQLQQIFAELKTRISQA